MDGFSTRLETQRKQARKFYDNKCIRCGYCKVPEILQIHHVDRNPRKGRMANIELLCPTCHEEQHFLAKTGRFNPLPRAKKPPEHTYKKIKAQAYKNLPQEVRDGIQARQHSGLDIRDGAQAPSASIISCNFFSPARIIAFVFEIVSASCPGKT